MDNSTAGPACPSVSPARVSGKDGVATSVEVVDVGIRGRLRQVGHRLRLDALEVDVTGLGLLFLPGHVDERPLDVVVYHLGGKSKTC